MSDRPPTADQQDAGSRDSHSLSVAEAAQRLGITPDAVRGRLHRGTLYGEKVGTEWRVFLPDVEAPTADRQATQQPPTAAQQ
ncbi:MAG: helix-turn-helix domain-containing protein, partial [Chloroflexota bacterium]|nr:helix-turn-helix domain-containing protein [Chloroflexota bacterium]